MKTHNHVRTPSAAVVHIDVVMMHDLVLGVSDEPLKRHLWYFEREAEHLVKKVLIDRGKTIENARKTWQPMEIRFLSRLATVLKCMVWPSK